MSTLTPKQLFHRLDTRMVSFMHNEGMVLLRYSLGIVFIWFGALKVIGMSPVVDLVRMTVYWFPPDIVVPVLGGWEILVGLGLVFNVAMRATLFLFWLQMAGTLLVLVQHPDVAFQEGNPFMLTVIGEFVVKNIVLICAGIALGGTLQKRKTTR